MILPEDIANIVHDFIRPLPTLHTIANWRNGSLRFDIDELKCAYTIKYQQETYIRKTNRCNIHDYHIFKNNPITACNCAHYHIIRPYFLPKLIWRDNYIALWKSGPKGNKLIWEYVDIYKCDNCNDLHMSFHFKKIDENRYICNCCYDAIYDLDIY
jgi:hypothetical protein